MPLEHSENMECHLMMDAVFDETETEARDAGMPDVVRLKRPISISLHRIASHLTTVTLAQADKIEGFRKFETEHRAVIERFGRLVACSPQQGQLNCRCRLLTTPVADTHTATRSSAASPPQRRRPF